jgi:hypothetical protein
VLEIRETSSGHPTAVLDGRYLHSPRDPVREAARVVAPIVQRDPPCVVLLGMGLGYAAEEMLRRTKSSAILIFEPDPELAGQLQSARDLSAVLQSPRVTSCTTANELHEALSIVGTAGFESLSLPGRREADTDKFEEAEARLRAFQSRLEVNANTLLRFGPTVGAKPVRKPGGDRWRTARVRSFRLPRGHARPPACRRPRA